MGILHHSRGKDHAVARTLGGSISASRVTKQPEDSAAIEPIHDISRRPQFSGLSGELGVASSLFPIQAKLTIGQPNDRYEQEADRVASEVVQQINAPASVQSSQGQSVQRTEAPEEEEIQAKPENSSLQRMEAIAGGEASTDLDTAINRARGSGQPLEAGLQRSMGQAMGADFRGVKVHTDALSDQLNRRINALAFTTGHDMFFRQGAYAPSSRNGQELLAHELSHVVQQNGIAVSRAQTTQKNLPQHPAIETKEGRVPGEVVQRTIWEHDGKTWKQGKTAPGDTDKYPKPDSNRFIPVGSGKCTYDQNRGIYTDPDLEFAVGVIGKSRGKKKYNYRRSRTTYGYSTNTSNQGPHTVAHITKGTIMGVGEAVGRDPQKLIGSSALPRPRQMNHMYRERARQTKGKNWLNTRRERTNYLRQVTKLWKGLHKPGPLSGKLKELHKYMELNPGSVYGVGKVITRAMIAGKGETRKKAADDVIELVRTTGGGGKRQKLSTIDLSGASPLEASDANRMLEALILWLQSGSGGEDSGDSSSDSEMSDLDDEV
ncbi:DUF4157 domain-containing protein [Microcoleus sp. POL10_C6]|uniref:DUF4157 domain-containing protein n=1 Tax=Microcoleus sp. POL10_C6 TaxID=2818852 RepID=UPI002FD464D9